MLIFVAQKYSQYFRFILTSSISDEYNFYFFCSGCYSFVENGIFSQMVDKVIIGTDDGTKEL